MPKILTRYYRVIKRTVKCQLWTWTDHFFMLQVPKPPKGHPWANLHRFWWRWLGFQDVGRVLWGGGFRGTSITPGMHVEVSQTSQNIFMNQTPLWDHFKFLTMKLTLILVTSNNWNFCLMNANSRCNNNNNNKPYHYVYHYNYNTLLPIKYCFWNKKI